MTERNSTLWLAAILLTFAIGAMAAEPEQLPPMDVKLNIVAGQVKLTRIGKTLSDVLTTGVPLFPGDLIETMRESKAELVYADSAVMRIKPLTLIEVQPFALKIFKGKMWHKFTKRGTEFVIDTPSLVAGIRGTVFDVAVSSRGKSVISVMEGAVEVHSKIRNGSQRDSPILVRQGFSTHAESGQALFPPYKFNSSKKSAEWGEAEWVAGDRSVEQLALNYYNLRYEYGVDDPRTVDALRTLEEAKKAMPSQKKKK